MDRNLIWAGALVLCVVFSGLGFSQYTEQKLSVEKAQAGLEECPQFGYGATRPHTIWVKSCKEYLDGMKEK